MIIFPVYFSVNLSYNEIKNKAIKFSSQLTKPYWGEGAGRERGGGAKYFLISYFKAENNYRKLQLNIKVKSLQKIKIRYKMKMRERQIRKLRNREQHISRQNSSSCRSIDCLNNILKVLKTSKDMVLNFIAQKKRLERSLQTAGKPFRMILIISKP